MLSRCMVGAKKTKHCSKTKQCTKSRWSHPRAHPRGPPAHSRGSSGWAHAGPKWVSPRWAQVGGPKPGPSGWPQPGPSGWAHLGPKWVGPSGPKPEIWDPKKSKNKNSQNQNPFCPKCRQGFFMSEKNVPAPFGALPAIFFGGRKHPQIVAIFAYFPWWANEPH